MKFTVIAFIIFLTFPAIKAGDRIEMGLFTGTSYYMGDINPVQHFYDPGPALGAIAKYNMNQYWVFKTGLTYYRISGDDNDFSYPVSARGASFLNNIYDFSFQFEFNFRPFMASLLKKPFSPYITAGMSCFFMQADGGKLLDSSGYINIPFGGGIKYGLSDKVTIGFEWLLKKSLSDEIDGVKSFGHHESGTLVHNNDWVSLAGFFITIKPFERKGDCPAYRY